MIHRYLFLLLILVLGPIGAQTSQPLFPKDKPIDPIMVEKDRRLGQIKSLLGDQILAWSRGDLNGFMKGYWNSDSLLFITSKGRTTGFNTVYLNYLKSYPTKEKMGNLDFELIEMRFLDEKLEIVQVSGLWKVNQGDKILQGHFSLIIKFMNQEPKIIIDHTF